MKKIIPLVASIALILIAGIFASAGTLALFHDEETIGVHEIQAGTLNLQVGSDDPCTVHLTFTDIKPGFFKKLHYYIKNTGTLDGKLTVELSAITNNELGRNEPEALVDDTGGWLGNGELGKYLTWNGMFIEGPSASQRVFGWKIPLNNLGGTTTSSYDLPAGEQNRLKIEFELPSTVGNIVQSDSVEFDIIFHLDQA